MAKPITGQYECVHSSGVGLNYFTSRIDRLTLQGNGRFVLVMQDRSRVAHAAQSLLSGQQVNAAAPETRREGSYTVQGSDLVFRFDDGEQGSAKLSWDGNGLQWGNNFFNKVSDSTLLPPTHRLQKDMEDIAKGLKIAGAIGGMAIKAAKTIQETLQTDQGNPSSQGPMPATGSSQPGPSAKSSTPPPVQSTAPYTSPSTQSQKTEQETLFCDQCGARVRPGKRFCNQCGAQLP